MRRGYPEGARIRRERGGVCKVKRVWWCHVLLSQLGVRSEAARAELTEALALQARQQAESFELGYPET